MSADFTLCSCFQIFRVRFLRKILRVKEDNQWIANSIRNGFDGRIAIEIELGMGKLVDSKGFAELYSKSHIVLLRYVMTLVPDRSQAEDVVQETARLLWKKFDEYNPEQPFLPWARKFAYYEVLKFRSKAARDQKYFSDGLVETMARERVDNDERLEASRKALQDCLAKLDRPSRDLLQERYGGETTLQELARRQGKSANALYLALYRIRHKLIECVRGTLRKEGWET